MEHRTRLIRSSATVTRALRFLQMICHCTIGNVFINEEEFTAVAGSTTVQGNKILMPQIFAVLEQIDITVWGNEVESPINPPQREAVNGAGATKDGFGESRVCDVNSQFIIKNLVYDIIITRNLDNCLASVVARDVESFQATVRRLCRKNIERVTNVKVSTFKGCTCFVVGVYGF